MDARAGDLYRQPRHPYTQVLLESSAALPEDAAASSGSALASAPETRCPFTDGCPLRQDRCFVEPPKLPAVGPQHRAACHFA